MAEVLELFSLISRVGVLGLVVLTGLRDPAGFRCKAPVLFEVLVLVPVAAEDFLLFLGLGLLRRGSLVDFFFLGLALRDLSLLELEAGANFLASLGLLDLLVDLTGLLDLFDFCVSRICQSRDSFCQLLQGIEDLLAALGMFLL